MNFLAHAEVARRLDPSPPFVLGAVLPDLLPMAGVRLDRSAVAGAVAEGWRAHHRADEAFHASPAFTAGVAALRRDLASLPTGPRRAVAHVGWELLLDDALAADEALVSSFTAALGVGRSVTDDARWHGLLDRFDGMRPGSSDAATIALRVQRACARRPRLAVADEHLPVVADALGAHQAAVAAAAPTVLVAVRDRLGP